MNIFLEGRGVGFGVHLPHVSNGFSEFLRVGVLTILPSQLGRFFSGHVGDGCHETWAMLVMVRLARWLMST